MQGVLAVVTISRKGRKVGIISAPRKSQSHARLTAGARSRLRKAETLLTLALLSTYATYETYRASMKALKHG